MIADTEVGWIKLVQCPPYSDPDFSDKSKQTGLIAVGPTPPALPAPDALLDIDYHLPLHP